MRLCLELAVIAYVYSVVLTEPEMILNSWYRFLEKYIGDYQWLFKPLIDCYKCVAGQMALWSYPILTQHYTIFGHLTTICMTIFISIIIDKIYTWNLRS